MRLAVLTPLKSASLNNSSRPKQKFSFDPYPKAGSLPIIVGYSNANDREIRGMTEKRELSYNALNAYGTERRYASEMRRCMSSDMCR